MCGRAASSALAGSTAAAALSLGLEEMGQINNKGTVSAKNPGADKCHPHMSTRSEMEGQDMPNAGPGKEFQVFRRSERGTAILEHAPMIWGLIPNNGTEHNPHLLPTDSRFSVSPHYVMFNARSETVCEKQSFSSLIRNGQTCVVPLDGYYEWLPTPHEKKKQPYFVRYKDERRPLLMAGVWSRVKTGRKARTAGAAHAKEETITSFAILTTSAHPEYSWLHPRQPVILWDVAIALEWLMSPGRSVVEKLRSIPSGGKVSDRSLNEEYKHQSIWKTSSLTVYPVSKKMNDCNYEGDDCMDEVKLQKVPSIESFFVPRRSKKARMETNPDRQHSPPARASLKTPPSPRRSPPPERKDPCAKEEPPDAAPRTKGAKDAVWACSKCTFVHAGPAKFEYLVCELCGAERGGA